MSTTVIDPITRIDVPARAPGSAVSWGAIIAGGAAAAALSLVLLMLGAGLGLTAVSPWGSAGISAETFGFTAIIWITLTQLFASGLGGYLAGRLRTKWADALGDEVYFRDTAHGFLAWCVASLGTAAVLTSVVGSIASGGLQAGATVAGQVASTATTAAAAGAAGAADANARGSADNGGPMAYFVDSLFRSNGGPRPVPAQEPAAEGGGGSRADSQGGRAESEQIATNAAEVTRIFANAIRTGSLPEDDIRYVGRVISERTDLSQSEAEQRVRDTFMRVQTTLRDAENAAKVAADDARKASAYASLWLVVSLFVGAFVASLMATFGGRQRDL
jgi:hypothetical protein